MRVNFSGKVTLVTGGGTGIGRASAILFAREGAKVVVADVAIETGTETVRLIQESGGEATFVTADVSRADQGQAGFVPPTIKFRKNHNTSQHERTTPELHPHTLSPFRLFL